MNPPTFRQIPSPSTLGTYAETVKSKAEVFPFTGAYNVYAGTCEANNPQAVNPKNSEPPKVTLAGGKGVATVTQPPINIRVMSGTTAGEKTEGVKVENATGTLVEPKHEESEEHSGCGETRKFTSTPKGALPHPGMPFGEYTLCVTAAKRKYTTPIFENSTPAGPTELELAKIANGGVVKEGPKNVAVIYLGEGAKAPPLPGELKEGTECP
jgi:hypothetical protein